MRRRRYIRNVVHLNEGEDTVMGMGFGRRTSSSSSDGRGGALALEFDAEAAEEKALVRVRQAGAVAPGRLYALRSGGAVLEVVAATIAIGGTAGAALLLSGSGEVLESPRPAVAFAAFVGSALVALMIAVAGQLLVAQAAVARNTQLMTSILAEMNHTVTATAGAQRPRPDYSLNDRSPSRSGSTSTAAEVSPAAAGVPVGSV
jgi:hypothetical protein